MPEQALAERLLVLPNGGSNLCNELSGLRDIVNEVLIHLKGVPALVLDPTIWNYFLVEYATILQEGRIRVAKIAPAIARMIDADLHDLSSVRDATDEMFEEAAAPVKIRSLLPTCQSAMVVRFAQEGLLADQDIDTNRIRLWITRRPTIEGELSRVEYKHGVASVVV